MTMTLEQVEIKQTTAVSFTAAAVSNIIHNFPQFEIMDARAVIERASKIKRGELHSIIYHKQEKQKGLADFHKLTRYSVQFTDYESMSVVKDLRASGVDANNPAVQNEILIETGGAPVLWYNTKTRKIKIRVPLNKSAHITTIYMIGDKVVSKEDYFKEWEARGYKVPTYQAEQPQPFRALYVDNTICLH